MMDTSAAAPVATQDVSAPATDNSNDSGSDSSSDNLSHDDSSEPKLTAAEKRKYKVKVDKEEQELELDDDEVTKRLQLAMGAEKRLKEAADERSAAKKEREMMVKLFEDARTDPEVLLSVLGKLGHDVDALIEERLWKKLQYERLSPEEKRAIEAETKAERLERELNERLERENMSKAEQEEAKIEQELDTEMSAVLELIGVEKSPRAVARVADLYNMYINAHGKLPTREEAAKLVRSHNQTAVADLLGTVTDIGAAIEQGLIPKALVEKIAQHQVSKAQKNLPGFASKPADRSEPRQNQRKRMTVSEFFK